MIVPGSLVRSEEDQLLFPWTRKGFRARRGLDAGLIADVPLFIGIGRLVRRGREAVPPRTIATEGPIANDEVVQRGVVASLPRALLHRQGRERGHLQRTKTIVPYRLNDSVRPTAQ